MRTGSRWRGIVLHSRRPGMNANRSIDMMATMCGLLLGYKIQVEEAQNVSRCSEYIRFPELISIEY